MTHILTNSTWQNAGDPVLTSHSIIEDVTFELAPVSLWIQDYSGLQTLFENWRSEGVVDLAAYFAASRSRIMQCAAQIRILKVNHSTLNLFEAENLDDLNVGLDRIFGPDSATATANEFVQLWNGSTEFTSQTVNYTLTGRRLDVQIRGMVLPGYQDTLGRVLIAVEDITGREAARRRLVESENYARGLFQYSPVSLWVEDFSAVKHLLDLVRASGITDFREFLGFHPEFVARCSREIRVIDVNQHTLTLFQAADKDMLLGRLSDVFRDKVLDDLKEELIDFWDGKIHQQREVVSYTLGGQELYLHLQLSVLPGHEDDWTLVQVALTDITARKKAEAYLEFLGKHDELTKVYNRSFYVDELSRLELNRCYPVSIIIIDVNGLKPLNDQFGHLAGDALLRRLGDVLRDSVKEPAKTCRTGGDEFAILLPDTDASGAQTVLNELARHCEVNNHFYTSPRLEISAGLATAFDGERLEEIVHLADERMYEAKRAYYRDRSQERRQNA